MSRSLTLVHGASGNLGSIIVKELLALGAAPSSIVAAVRDVNKDNSKELTNLGVQLRVAEYNDPAGLEKAYADVDTVVFMPTTGPTFERATTAENSISAAKKAGVRRFVAVSWGNGKADSVNALIPGYLYLESRLRTIAGGPQWLIVRQGQWIENGLGSFQYALQSGVLTAASSANSYTPYISRPDVGRAIAAATFKKDLVGKVLNIEGNVAYSYEQIAEILSEIGGKKIVFKTITVAELEGILKYSLPDAIKSSAGDFAHMFASFSSAAELGEFKVSNDFFELTGKQPESFTSYLKKLLQK